MMRGARRPTRQLLRLRGRHELEHASEAAAAEAAAADAALAEARKAAAASRSTTREGPPRAPPR